MRRLFLLILTILLAEGVAARRYAPADVPNVQRIDRMRFTSDPDGLLSPAAVATLDSICYDLRRRDIAQVAVVAVESVEGDDAFTFAVDLFDEWGVGRADRNNGLGILLVDDLHEIRFVTGGGLEGVLPDAICKRIQLKYMLPHFREGDYDTGMVEGLRAVQQLLAGSELDLGGTDDYAEEDLPAAAIAALVALCLLVPIGVLLLVAARWQRCPRCHAWALHLERQERFAANRDYDLVEYTYVCRKCGQRVRRREKSYRDDGFGSGGGMIFGGGGFGRFGGGTGGGFGGGSFGGGGAGSRW